MSEVADETVDTVVESEKVELPELSKVAEIFKGAADEHVTAMRAQVAILRRGEDVSKQIADIRDVVETDDETVLKFRAEIENLNAKILKAQEKVEKYISENLVQSPPTEEEKDAAKSLFNDHKAKLRDLLAVAQDVAKTDLTPYLGTIPNFRGTGSAKPVGETRRPRVKEVSIDGTVIYAKDKNGQQILSKDGTPKSTFSVAAIALGRASDVVALQKAYFAEAGSDDMEKIADVVEFAFDDKDGKPRIIRVAK